MSYVKICLSIPADIYQRSIPPGAGDGKYYSRRGRSGKGIKQFQELAFPFVEKNKMFVNTHSLINLCPFREGKENRVSSIK